MSSRFVMANIQMPIEIKHDNTIVPLQQLSNVHVVSIISSITDIQVDRSLPDIITQTNAMFKKQDVSPSPEPEQEDRSCDEPEPTIEPPVVQVPQLWVRPNELRKTPLPFKKNSSFKNHGKYKHRTTAKKRDSC
jgi:hypothetical protein